MDRSVGVVDVYSAKRLFPSWRRRFGCTEPGFDLHAPAQRMHPYRHLHSVRLTADFRFPVSRLLRSKPRRNGAMILNGRPTKSEVSPGNSFLAYLNPLPPVAHPSSGHGTRVELPHFVKSNHRVFVCYGMENLIIQSILDKLDNSLQEEETRMISHALIQIQDEIKCEKEEKPSSRYE